MFVYISIYLNKIKNIKNNIETFEKNNKMNDTINYDLIITGQKINDIFTITISKLISIFGVVTNIINLIIFSDSSKFEDQIYIYLRGHCFADILYLMSVLVCSDAFVAHYLPLKFVKSYFIQLTGLYLCSYLTSSLAIFNIFIELIVSLQRCLILMNGRYCKFTKKRTAYIILTIVFILSLIVYSHEIVFFEVMKVNGLNQTSEMVLYGIEKNSLGLKYGKMYENIAISIQIFRGPVCLIMMILINSMTWYQFRLYLNRKTILKRRNFHFFPLILLIFQIY
jgi:hypothetical protein